MKYVKLTGWGNNKTHLIPLKAINSFSEEDKYTAIRLDNGSTINVQESFSMIEELLDLAGAKVYDDS
jgi:DNA-binding LytR/AlgR family response regulator